MHNSIKILNKTDISQTSSSSFSQQSQVNSSNTLQTRISIIVPVYYEEKILSDTLRNYSPDLLNKYNAELIVSDGGSKDKTSEIALQFTQKVLIHKGINRQTIAEGRNKGAEIAKGDVFVFINGDTVPVNPEEFFKKINKWLNGETPYSNAVALACAVTVRPEDKLFKDTVFYFCHNLYVRLLNVIGMGMGRGECQIIRAEYFNRVNGYNNKLTAGEDFDLYRRLAKQGKISFVKDITVYESPRRFRKYGYFRILLSWTLNSISVMFRNRSVSKEWEAVR